MKLLWLASWYPNELTPFDGDFIQRHARALALFQPVTVIHAVQSSRVAEEHSTLSVDGALTEIVIYLSARKTGWQMIDRVVNNRRYLIACKKVLHHYFEKNDKPTLVHVHVAMKAGLLALWLKRKFGLRYVVTEHYGIYNKMVEDSYRGKSPVYKFYIRRIFNKASVFMSVSKKIADDINHMVTRKPYRVVFNTVDTSLFYLKNKGEINGRFRFIHVSNMVPLKNTATIINAFSEVSKKSPLCELVLVGPFPDDVYQSAVQSGLLDVSLFFTGEIPYASVAMQMQEAHSLVLFSTTENMPCVVLESLCCGLPVVSSRTGGIPEVINEENGILVALHDKEALVQAMLQMMNSYQQYSRDNISKKAKSDFSYQTIGRAISALYDSIV